MVRSKMLLRESAETQLPGIALSKASAPHYAHGTLPFPYINERRKLNL